MRSLFSVISLSLLALAGCSETSNQKNQTDASLPTLPEDKVQTLSLGSLTERLLGLPDQKMTPIVGDKWIVQPQADYIEVYEKESQEKAKGLDGLDAQVAPVFLDESTLLVADSAQKLWSVDLETSEKRLVAQLPSPLICSPLMVEGQGLFLQYLNDVVEMLALDGSSQWRTAVMATTSYYRQTEYAPCAAGGQIFFAYPGSSVLAISQESGQIEWISAPIAQSSISTTAFQVPQVQSAIKMLGDLVVFTTLDQQLFCLDKDSGIVVKNWALWQRSPTLVSNDCLYFVNDMGALTAYDGLTQKMLWQHENFSSLGIEALVALGQDKIVAQMSHQQLYLINGDSGETLHAYQHSYPSLQLITTDKDQRLFGLDQRKNLIDIPGTVLS